MATPSWFSAEAYLTNKLATLPSSSGITTLPQLMVAFEKAGFAGEAGAYKHFQLFGDAEGVSPNAYFNATQYMQAKAVAALGSASDYNVGLVASAFAQLGMSAWDHYQKFNATEDINPSNAFSEDVYLAAKAALVGKPAAEVKAAIVGAGMTVLQHYMQFAGKNGEVPLTTSVAVPADKQVGGTTGQTFTLTDSTDTITGTSGNDTIIAGLKGTAATLTAGDSINGSTGTDTIELYGNANMAPFATANVVNVEIVKAQASASGAALDVSLNSGVKEAWISRADVSDDATGAVTVTLAKAQTAGITGTTVVNSSKGNTAVTFTYTDAAGTADTATLALSSAKLSSTGTGKGSVTMAGIESLNITAVGANSIGDLVAAAAQTVTVSGAGSVTAKLAPGTSVLKSVDASANSGGVNLTMTATQFGANDVKVTGGTGNDSIVFTDQLTTKATVDLGNGDDTLSIKQGATALISGSTFNAGSGTDTLVLDTTKTAIDATSGKMFTGFENIKLVDASSYAVGSIAGITGYEIASAAASSATITKLASATTVKISASSTAAQILTLADNSDATSAVNVSLDNSAAVTAASGVAQSGISTLIDTNAHVLNFASNGTVVTGSVNKIDLTGASSSLAQLTNIKITGAQAAELTTDAASALTLVDGSSATGALKITATNATKAMTIKGGDAQDVIVASDVADAVSTIVGGKGADTITLGSTAANNKGDVLKLTGHSDSTLTGFDIVSNFAAATTKPANADKLDLSVFGFTGAQAGVFTLASGKVTVTNTGASATPTIAAADAANFFVNSGAKIGVALHETTTQTFAFIDANADGNWDAATDSVVLLVGNYMTDQVAAANFTFA